MPLSPDGALSPYSDIICMQNGHPPLFIGDGNNSGPHRRWHEWLANKALPLWGTAGFDSNLSLFHERLNWDGSAVQLPSLRLMVQARQISTYLRAQMDGFYQGAELALGCLEHMQNRYHRADGEPGWIFSIDRDGRPSDGKRDLYAHAFVLFAYGWAIRYTGDVRFKHIARCTATDIQTIFSGPHGGYNDTMPRHDAILKQNPHMHLLEAYLVLFESTQDQFYLDNAAELVALAENILVEKNSGMLLEFFDSNWKPCGTAGTNRVEPGHLFEWSWLIHEYLRIASPPQDKAQRLADIADSLYLKATIYGLRTSQGLVCDAITDDGTLLENSLRIWPQTEFLRLLSRRRQLSLHTTLSMDNLTDTFFSHFLAAEVEGGWIDRLDENGNITLDHMPASSLYHIYGAARELAR